MLEKFEKMVLRIKKRIHPKAMAVTAFVIFGITMLYGMQMANMFKREKQKAEDEYNKAMYQLVAYAENVDALITKARVTTTVVEGSKIYAEIWKQADLAKQNLSEIPVNQPDMENTSKFLSQASDYSYSLLKQTVEGQPLSDKQYEELEGLNKSSGELTEILNEIYDDLNTGRLRWDEVEKASKRKLETGKEQSGYSGISKVTDSFKEYAGLIYDGAFSNHLENIKPKMLTGKEISKDEAKEKIKKILEFNKENKIDNIWYKGDSEGNLAVYIFEVKYVDSEKRSNVEVTKDTGLVSLIVRDRDVKERKIDEKEATEKGLIFLKNMGMDNMKDTYYTIQDNMITINYAATQGNVILYPDLVKVKVAMDNGEVCSVESLGYIFNHIKRTDITPSITLEQAQSILNKNIKVEKSQLAIIPTESKQEVLTYEFTGKINEKDFLIYINAKTRVEEQILIILDTENGTLTM